MSIIAVVAGFALIIFAIFQGPSPASFIEFQSVLITIGGTLCATMASFPVSQLKSSMASIKFAFGGKESNSDDDIEMIIHMATVARKGGLLALENEIGDINNHFVKKGVMLIVDGSSSELVKAVMETEIDNIFARHEKNSAVFRRAAQYAPGFGMIGTLIGLINMLQQLSDPSTLGPSMAVALITTFYGSFMANLLFTPIAVKLDCLNEQEELHNKIFLEGILSIQVGENPRTIREKLEAFVPASAHKDDNASRDAKAGE